MLWIATLVHALHLLFVLLPSAVVLPWRQLILLVLLLLLLLPHLVVLLVYQDCTAVVAHLVAAFRRVLCLHLAHL